MRIFKKSCEIAGEQRFGQTSIFRLNPIACWLPAPTGKKGAGETEGHPLKPGRGHRKIRGTHPPENKGHKVYPSEITPIKGSGPQIFLSEALASKKDCEAKLKVFTDRSRRDALKYRDAAGNLLPAFQERVNVLKRQILKMDAVIEGRQPGENDEFIDTTETKPNPRNLNCSGDPEQIGQQIVDRLKRDREERNAGIENVTHGTQPETTPACEANNASNDILLSIQSAISMTKQDLTRCKEKVERERLEKRLSEQLESERELIEQLK